MRHDIDLGEGLRRSDEAGDSVLVVVVSFPELAFGSPDLVSCVSLDLQGACVHSGARFADSAFRVPVCRGHGAQGDATNLTESLLLGASGFLWDLFLVFSAAKNRFHLSRSLADKDPGSEFELLSGEMQLPRHCFTTLLPHQ